MAVITWRGLSGSWSSGANWQGNLAPGPSDIAVFPSGGVSTVQIDSAISVGGATIAAGANVNISILSTLFLGGPLVLSGGTLSFGPGGVIEGGTVDLRGGGLLFAQGGTADGVAWLGALGRGLTITAATAAATEAAASRLALAGTVTLESGDYAGATFVADTFSSGQDEIDVVPGGAVTFDAASTITALGDDPTAEAGVMPAYAGLVLGGAGEMKNDGTITSDLCGVFAPLSISASVFENGGAIDLSTAVVPDVQVTFEVTQGGQFPTPVTLTYDEVLAPTLVVSSADFVNAGIISGAAATLIVQGASFVNTDTISLSSVPAVIPFSDGQTAYLASTMLVSSIDVVGSVAAFSNEGVIAAGTIEFDDNLTLAQLGSVEGALVFTGTFDLQGGTLDLARVDPGESIVFAGTVRNGTIIADSGTLVTTGAILQSVTILQQQASATLDNVTGGTVTLDGGTSELDYTSATSLDGLSVVIADPGGVERIGLLAGGGVTFGPDTSIQDSGAGSTLEVFGAGSFVEDGRILLSGPVALQISTLDGSGTIALANGATLELGAVGTDGELNVEFQGPSDLLVLPASGASGVNLIGLSLSGFAAGDTIDFAGVSSVPILGQTFGAGAAILVGGTLEVQGASGEQAELPLSRVGGLSFTVSPDETGGTLVTIACFRRGTRIATPDGEVPVEQLRLGDAILTRDGGARPVKWIGRRRYGAHLVARQPQLRPVRIARGALGGGRPRRILYLSALHGVVLPSPDGAEVLVPAAALVGCWGITRAPMAAVAYLHIELERPGILLAEGAFVESFADHGSRGLFDNVSEYAALFPGPSTPSVDLPLPRVNSGWRLHAIRGALSGGERSVTAPGSRLRWAIDRHEAGRISGWAIDEDMPDAPVVLAAMSRGNRVGCSVANAYRVDLDHRGIVGGLCGFDIEVPSDLPEVVVRTLGGAVLTGQFAGP